MRLLLQIAMLSLFVIAVFFAWQVGSFMLVPHSENSEEVVFEIKPGMSFHQIAESLKAEELIDDTLKLKIIAKIMGYSGKMRVGEYRLKRDMTPLKVLSVLSSGKSIAYVMTLKEGINMYEVAELFEKMGLGTQKEFLDLCKNQKFISKLLSKNHYSLEGYLYPETYHVTKYTGAKKLIRLMVENFKTNFALVKANAKVKLDRHEAVTFASIIEKETGVPSERPLISSVFHNRLNKKMRLQSDPTILYGILDQTGKMKKNITKADILEFNRFNTYRVKALPFGPIANPGKEALWAAFHPEESDYLFFVSRNDGTHVFSKDYAGHSRAVKKFQLDRQMREGRSWRDLHKKSSENTGQVK